MTAQIYHRSLRQLRSDTRASRLGAYGLFYVLRIGKFLFVGLVKSQRRELF